MSLEDRQAEVLARVLRDERSGAESAEALAKGRARLMAPQVRRPRSARTAVLSWALAAACVAGVWFAYASTTAPPAITWEVRGPRTVAHHWIGDTAQPVEMAFSDGSKALIEPGGRVRVLASDARGVSLLVERGGASFDVNPAANERWSVLAGPFEVKVTGTRFRTAWDPARDAVDVSVSVGSVHVEAEAFGAPVRLQAGQGLRATAASRTYELVQTGAPPGVHGATPSGQPAPASVPSAQLGAEPSASPQPSGAKQPTSAPEASNGATPGAPWTKLLQSGQYDAIVAAAEQEGVATVLESRSLADLRALADAARYAARADLAERALLSIRKRSAQGASREAFLLGRLEEGRGKLPAALGWYERYLAEAPNGPFASEALGSRFRIVTTIRGKDAARPLAEEYLRRYPDGVHAGAARRVLE
jgi:hypothetical protein